MWVRFGRWVQLGVHFGRQNTRLEVMERHFVNACLRLGEREWNHGPRREELGQPLNPPFGSPLSPWENMHPDPEPLRWGVRKVVRGASLTPVETKHRVFRR